MIQAPANTVLVKVKNVFNRHFSNIAKTAFSDNNASDVNPADYVTIVGGVVSVPRRITTERREYVGFTTENIRPGDTAIFSYSVIYELDISDQNQKFKNCFWYKGQEYWAADILKVFGVIRDGNIMMVNGYCMIEKMKPISTLILPNHLKNMLNVSEAVATKLSFRSPHSLRNILPGDTVFYNPLKVQKYTLPTGKEIGIIEDKHLMGNKIADYIDLQGVFQ